MVRFAGITCAKLAAMEFPPFAPEPERLPTWKELVALDCRLLQLEARARGLHREHPGDDFDDWRAWSEQVKQPMMKLVGWEAEKYELRHSAAYDVAHDRLFAIWATGKVPK